MNGDHQSDKNVDQAANTTPSPVPQQDNPARVPEPETEQQLANMETDIEKRMSAFERSTLGWTKGMFVVTFFTMVFIALQWREIRNGSVDTHELALAAKSQATNTEKQVKQ